jgi:hypothetical protein
MSPTATLARISQHRGEDQNNQIKEDSKTK